MNPRAGLWAQGAVEELAFGLAPKPSRRADQLLKGQRAVKAVAATGRGKPLRASTPGTDSAGNKAERLRADQDVKRLRKPEGVAEPGEAIPVQVAARI
jgi:hypothetical protein